MTYFASVLNAAQGSPVLLLVGSVCLAWAIAKAYPIIALYINRQKLIKEYGCLLPPTIFQWVPYFGLDLAYRGSKWVSTHTLLENDLKDVRKYSPAYTTTCVIMGRRIISTADPEVIKHVLATNFNDFELLRDRKKSLDEFIGSGIFNVEGHRWRQSRDLLRPYFSRDQIDHLPMFEKHVARLLHILPLDTGKTIDIQPLFFSLMLDTATEFLFGQATDTLLSLDASATQQQFGKDLEDIVSEIAVPKRNFILSWLFGNPKQAERIRFVHGYIEHLALLALEKRKEQGQQPAESADSDSDGTANGHRVVLDELSTRAVEPHQIRDELLSLLMAGRDTTATLLSTLFFMLARHPDVVARIRAEIEATLGASPDPSTAPRPTLQQLRSMTYLRHCVLETLRLRPVIPLNARVASKDTVLPTGGGGRAGAEPATSPLFVPRGTLIGLQIHAMHRRADIFGDEPDEFRPERWSSSGLRPGWGFLPFHGGPRVCLGQQLALTEVEYVTVRLLQVIGRIESRDERPWTEHFVITVRSKWGCNVALFREPEKSHESLEAS